MLSENLKALRKQKGMSQEVMAQQLNVVRQTVSKWEQGLSVPDAQMLTNIAELFEVPVSSLLGEKIGEKADTDEIAAQLAVLNEQLAAKTKRSKRIFKILLAVFAGIILMYALLIACNMVLPAKRITGAGDENIRETLAQDREKYEKETLVLDKVVNGNPADKGVPAEKDGKAKDGE